MVTESPCCSINNAAPHSPFIREFWAFPPPVCLVRLPSPSPSLPHRSFLCLRLAIHDTALIMEQVQRNAEADAEPARANEASPRLRGCRDASPNSSTTSPNASAGSTLTGDTEPPSPSTPAPPAPASAEMDSSFGGINARRNKLAAGTQQPELGGVGQPQMLGRGLMEMAHSSQVPRFLAARNWRLTQGPTTEGGNTGEHHPLAMRPGPSYRMGHGSSNTFGGEAADENSGALLGYCLDRGNGNYTQMIPADMLPPLRDIPAVQRSTENMVVLRPLSGMHPPDGPGGFRVAIKVSAASYTSQASTQVSTRLKTPPLPQPPSPPSDAIQVTFPITPTSLAKGIWGSRGRSSAD